MPCFYCGKPISLVRRIADPDFCSEDHRQKYHELTRLALNRLVETRDHLESVAPKGRRPRAAPALGPQPETTPPVAEPLPERLGATARAVKVSPAEEYAVLSHTVRLPGLPPPRSRPALRAGPRAPGRVPGVVQAAEPPPIATLRPSGMLPITTQAALSEPHLASRALLRGPGMPVQPLEAPPKLTPAPGDGKAVVSADYSGTVSALRLPTPTIPPAHVAPPQGELRPGRRPPPGAPAAPARTVREVGFAFPTTLPVPGARPRAGISVAAWRPEPFSVPLGSGAASLPAVLARVFLPPSPVVQPFELTAATRLAQGAPAPLPPETPFQHAALPVTDPGRPLPPATGDITFRHSPVWRSRPVAFELPPIAVPPVLSVPSPIAMGTPVIGAGQAVAAPIREWRPEAPGLPRLSHGVGRAFLCSTTVASVPAPAGQARPALGMLRAARSPDFPVARQFSFGGVARSVRRALGSGEPLPVGTAGSRPGMAGLRESPVPGFRIAAWAFTHSPGLTPVAVPCFETLLSAQTPRPAGEAGFHPAVAAWRPTPAASAIGPAWRAGVTGEWLPIAPTEPPALGEACRLTVEPVRAAVPLPREASVGLPSPRLGIPEGRRLVWAVPAGQLTVGPTFPLRVASLGRARRPTPRLGQAPVVLSATVWRPSSRQAPAPVLAAASLSTASPALLPAARQPAARAATAQRWRALSVSASRFTAIRPSLAPLGRPAAGYTSERPPETLSGRREARFPERVVFGQAPVVHPRGVGIAGRGPIRDAARKVLSGPTHRDSAAVRRPKTDASVTVRPPLSVALPGGVSAAAAVRLPLVPPAVREGRAQNPPAARWRLTEQPWIPSPLAVPVGAGISGCATDLAFPDPCPVAPPPCDRPAALLDQPEEVPLQPRVLLEARPCSPIPHRFERLPLEPPFAPALRVARLGKRLPFKLVFSVAAGLLALLLGAVSWNAMREGVRERAAVLVEDDFSSGIERWTSAATDWTRDPAGFVQVGSLALLGPSLRMRDYRLEFMGELEQQSLAWVFRAQDLDNHYAMKIAVLKPGPLPTLALVRSRVLLGQQTPLGQVPIRVFLHSSAPFRVQMRVSGNDFTTFVNNEQVDFWTDDRLGSGGVGFFCEKGSRARLYWVKVSHQDDLLGKLCSFLAPNDVSRNGSWK